MSILRTDSVLAFTLEMTPAQSPESCFVCEQHGEFYDLLADADFRLKARLLLVARYFEPRERVALLESFGIGDFSREKAQGSQKGTSNIQHSTSNIQGLEEAERVGAKLNEEAEEVARKKGPARYCPSWWKYTGVTPECLGYAPKPN